MNLRTSMHKNICPHAYLKEGDARAVDALGKLSVGPIEVDPVLARLQSVGVHITVAQKHVQGHARPNGGAHCTGAPTEALALPGDVHLLAAIARADESDGQGSVGQGNQLVH